MLAHASSISFITDMEPLYVRIIKILGLYVFPAIIFALLMVLLFVPTPKKTAPRTAQAIDAEINRLMQEKQNLVGR